MTVPARLLARVPRPGRSRVPAWLLLPTWVAVGALVVAYVLGMLAFMVLAGVVATARFLVSPPLALLLRLTGRAPARPRPGAVPPRSLSR